jgi:hypothetical protein
MRMLVIPLTLGLHITEHSRNTDSYATKIETVYLFLHHKTDMSQHQNVEQNGGRVNENYYFLYSWNVQCQNEKTLFLWRNRTNCVTKNKFVSLNLVLLSAVDILLIVYFTLPVDMFFLILSFSGASIGRFDCWQAFWQQETLVHASQ